MDNSFKLILDTITEEEIDKIFDKMINTPNGQKPHLTFRRLLGNCINYFANIFCNISCKLFILRDVILNQVDEF